MDRQSRLNWFKMLDGALGKTPRRSYDLALQVDVAKEQFKAMRAVSAKYLRVCAGIDDSLSDDHVLDNLDEIMPSLANRTPNGVVLPKREVAAEFNEFHHVVANWLQSLNLKDIDSVFCPPTLRIMAGKGDPKMAGRPYATSKMHADVWAGDPGDGVNVVISLCGDVERTAVDFFRPPDDFENHLLRQLKDYDEGNPFVSSTGKYEIEPKVGTVVFFDCIVPHKTVRKDGKSRGTIQFNIRRKISAADKQKIEASCDHGKLVNFIPYGEWCKYGVTKFMQFGETLADARNGVFSDQPYSKSFYSIVDRL